MSRPQIGDLIPIGGNPTLKALAAASPGADEPIKGDWTLGYFGSVSQNEVGITRDQLKPRQGTSEPGFENFPPIVWHKFVRNNEIIFMCESWQFIFYEPFYVHKLGYAGHYQQIQAKGVRYYQDVLTTSDDSIFSQGENLSGECKDLLLGIAEKGSNWCGCSLSNEKIFPVAAAKVPAFFETTGNLDDGGLKCNVVVIRGIDIGDSGQHINDLNLDTLTLNWKQLHDVAGIQGKLFYRPVLRVIHAVE